MGSQFNTALWGGAAPQGVVAISARGLISDVFRNLTVIRPGQTPNTDSVDDAFRMLGKLTDAWLIERLLVKRISRTLLSMTGAAQYVVEQHRIERAGYIPVSGTEYPVNVFTNVDRWAEIADKSLTGDPSDLYVEYNATNALEATLNPWPIPSAGQLAYYQWAPVFTGFEDLDTEYAFPPGYALALEWNLSYCVAPKFVTLMAKGSDVLLPQIKAEAVESKARIKRANVPADELGCDPALVSTGYGFDIRTGRY